MKPKIPPKRVKADDCAVFVGRRIVEGEVVEEGTPHYVHKGEWVDVIPVTSIEQFMSFQSLLQSAGQDEITARAEHEMAEGHVGSALASLQKVSKGVSEAFDNLLERLADVLIDWNWTDMVGKNLPKPHGNPKVLKRLTTDEVLWLLAAVKFETRGERKNA